MSLDGTPEVAHHGLEHQTIARATRSFPDARPDPTRWLDRTQEEIAHEIGTARESVSRALKQLRRKGLIKPLGKNRMLVPDLKRLQSTLPG